MYKRPVLIKMVFRVNKTSDYSSFSVMNGKITSLLIARRDDDMRREQIAGENQQEHDAE